MSAQIKTIIKKGIQTSWRNKRLWLFGVFVSFIGTLGEVEILFKANDLETPSLIRQVFQTVASTGLFSLKGLKAAAEAAKTDPAIFLQILFVQTLALSILLLFVWFITLSHGALVHGISQIFASKNATASFSLRVGLKKFWPVFGALVNIKITIGLLLFLLALLIPFSAAVFVAAFLAVFLLIILIHILTKFMVCAVVLENTGFFAGIKKAFSAFGQNTAAAIRLASYLFLINVAAVVALVAAVFLVLTPFFLIFGTTILFQAGTAFIFNVYLSSLIILALILLVSSALTTFHWACWTRLYLSSDI